MKKKYWIALVAASLLAIGAGAQTSASGSATGNASVQPGQAGASASTNQSVQTPGASVNGDASANTKASSEHGKKNQSGSGANANANSGSAVSASDASSALSSGTTMQAELTKPLDAKKAKAGDEVSAKVTQDVKSDGKVVVHKGSKLVGHVTEAKARTKENSESKLGIVFDKAVLKGGQEVAFNGVIQALAPPVHGDLGLSGSESSSLGAPMGGGGGGSARSSGGGALGGVTGAAGSAVGSTVGGATGAVGNVAGSAGGAVNGTVNNTAGLAANGTLGAGTHGEWYANGAASGWLGVRTIGNRKLFLCGQAMA